MPWTKHLLLSAWITFPNFHILAVFFKCLFESLEGSVHSMQGKSGNTTVTSFYSNSRKKVTVRLTVHTDPSKKQSLLKLKTLAFAFSYQSKTTENGNGKLMINEVILPAQVSLRHKSKMTSDCTLCFQIKHLMHFFREKTPFSNFSGIVWMEPKHPFNQCLRSKRNTV